MASLESARIQDTAWTNPICCFGCCSPTRKQLELVGDLLLSFSLVQPNPSHVTEWLSIIVTSHAARHNKCLSLMFSSLWLASCPFRLPQVKLETPTVTDIYYWQGSCSEFYCLLITTANLQLITTGSVQTNHINTFRCSMQRCQRLSPNGDGLN